MGTAQSGLITPKGDSIIFKTVPTAPIFGLLFPYFWYNFCPYKLWKNEVVRYFELDFGI